VQEPPDVAVVPHPHSSLAKDILNPSAAYIESIQIVFPTWQNKILPPRGINILRGGILQLVYVLSSFDITALAAAVDVMSPSLLATASA